MSATLRRRQGGWVAIDNATLRDKRLSFRARGILAYLLTHADGWVIKSESIAQDGTEGREAVRTALRELGEHGYYRIIRTQGPDGRWSSVVEVSPTPVAEWVGTGDVFPGAGSPGAGSPDAGSPGPLQKDQENDQENTPPTEGGAPAVLSEAAALDQRAKALSRVHYEAMPLSNFMGTVGVVKKAIRSGRYSDAQIETALRDLVADNRQVSTATLHYALEGGPVVRPRHGGMTPAEILALRENP